MGQVPPKYFTPSAPYGSSEAANTVNQANPAAVNPQTPLLPPNFTDPGKMQTTQQATPSPMPANGAQNYGQNQWGKMFGKLFLLLLFLPGVLSATTTVTGKIQNLGTGNMTNGAFVRFWLRGCAGNQPRINGTSVIGPSQGGVFFFDIAADASGNVSGTLYSTRDSTGLLGGDIECGGSLTAVWYGMQIFVAGKGGPEMPIHAKSGSTLDITQAAPITFIPVVTAPTGDSTYARIDGGNQPFLGNIAAPNVTATTLVKGSQVQSTVTTGTPPLIVASTTLIPNLNAALLGGLSAPGSAIVGISDAQSLTNKNFDISLNVLKTSSNIAGHVPRNNGTQYVDAQLAASDLSNGTTGSGAIVLATSPTIATPTLTSPVLNTSVSGTGVQGTDTKVLSAGTVSGTAIFLCTDANGGSTTSGCPFIQSVKKTSSTCNTGGGSNSACQDTLTWPVTFGSTNYVPVCQGLTSAQFTGQSTTNQAAVLVIDSYTATQVVVTTETMRSLAAQFSEIDCIGVGTHP